MSPPRPFVWVIGGGVLQIPVIKEAVNRGFRVIVSDALKTPAAASYASKCMQISTHDVEAHVEACRPFSGEIAAVVADGIDAGETAAAMREELGLPGDGREVARRVGNKDELRKCLGAEAPVFTVLPDWLYPSEVWAEWERVANNADVTHYPCVVKPVDNSATRGISIVRDVEDFAVAVPKAVRANKNGKFILVEQCLSGPEVAIDMLVYDNVPFYVNGAKRVFHSTLFGIEIGHTNPYVPDDDAWPIAQMAARKLGVTQGPFKVDMIKDPKYGWVILETATRLSGGFDHTHTCPIATGKDVVGAVLDSALGLPLDMEKIAKKKDKYAACYAPVFESGDIDGWKNNGFTKVKGIRWLIVRNNQCIEPLENCAARPLFIITEGDTEQQAWDIALEVASKIEPVYK